MPEPKPYVRLNPPASVLDPYKPVIDVFKGEKVAYFYVSHSGFPFVGGSRPRRANPL